MGDFFVDPDDSSVWRLFFLENNQASSHYIKIPEFYAGDANAGGGRWYTAETGGETQELYRVYFDRRLDVVLWPMSFINVFLVQTLFDYQTVGVIETMHYTFDSHRVLFILYYSYDVDKFNSRFGGFPAAVDVLPSFEWEWRFVRTELESIVSNEDKRKQKEKTMVAQ